MGNVKTVVTMFINGISYATEIVKIGDLKDYIKEETDYDYLVEEGRRN